MSKLYTLWSIIRKLKYVVVIFFIVLINGFLDDNSWMENYKRKQQISRIKGEISALREQFEEDTRRFDALEKHSEIERVAREKYFMKRPDEDIFLVVDSDPAEELPEDTITEINTAI
ncbi:MAG: septum formation initiator family protein [Bacteroidaceae bacterium]|nr:septum formation initiator family protein [Bacteroidaceae bacterium]